MENNRLKQIRESERKSHIEMYSNDELYKDIREDKCKRHLYFFR